MIIIYLIIIRDCKDVYSYQNKYETKKQPLVKVAFRDPPGIRTQDPNIKSVVLYRLS